MMVLNYRNSKTSAMNIVTEHEVINSVKIIKACEIIMSYQLKLKKKIQQ